MTINKLVTIDENKTRKIQRKTRNRGGRPQKSILEVPPK